MNGDDTVDERIAALRKQIEADRTTIESIYKRYQETDFDSIGIDAVRAGANLEETRRWIRRARNHSSDIDGPVQKIQDHLFDMSDDLGSVKALIDMARDRRR